MVMILYNLRSTMLTWKFIPTDYVSELIGGIIKEAMEGNQNQSKKVHVPPPLCQSYVRPLKSKAITDHKSRFSLMSLK